MACHRETRNPSRGGITVIDALIQEAIYFSIVFSVMNLLAVIGGVIYGFNRKVGAALLVCGLIASFILIVVALTQIDLSSAAAVFHWGAAIGGFVSGFTAQIMWHIGKDWAQKQKRGFNNED